MFGCMVCCVTLPVVGIVDCVLRFFPQDPMSDESTWILILIFHPVSVFNLDSIIYVDSWTFSCI